MMCIINGMKKVLCVLMINRALHTLRLKKENLIPLTPYRFVILHHQSPSGEHWDVMLETATALTTWSIPPQCLSGSSFSCPAVPLPAHRKHYLDYEGEVTGNRGTVIRVDTGVYEQLSPETFILHGSIFTGQLALDKDTMTFVEAV